MIDLKELLYLFLPEEIDWNRYDITATKKIEDKDILPFTWRLEFWIEEKNIVPPDLDKKWVKIESKWFYDPVRIFDFPVRSKLAKLVIKRRRWINKETWEYLNTPINFKEDSTMTSKELVAFLK